MGTAGPLALARDILDDKSGDPFFVLNRYPVLSLHLLCCLLKGCQLRFCTTRSRSSYLGVHPGSEHQALGLLPQACAVICSAAVATKASSAEKLVFVGLLVLHAAMVTYRHA